MKAIVVREMTALVFKPASSTSTSASRPAPKHIRFDDAKPKAKSKPAEKPTTAPANAHAAYYATITFNQIVLSPSLADQQVARQLIDVYFTFFRDLLGVMERTGDDEMKESAEDEEDKKGSGKAKAKARKMKDAEDAGFLEVEDTTSRHVSAILTGVNRALPFAKLTTDDVGFNKHIDTLFLISHQSTFNISLQALLLLQQITLSSAHSKETAPIVNRYYRTLYASLHDSRLATSNKQAMYLNLLFKSAKSDPNPDRVAAFVRRFLQVLASNGGGGPELTAGGLYLIGEVSLVVAREGDDESDVFCQLFSTVKGLRQLVTSAPQASDGEYDARKRDPSYAHATSLPLWELVCDPSLIARTPPWC
jgi:ribosome biogenesis protein MAK21